ncbi:cysteine--tRNA ligase [Patescibacteria group bacterium]
MKLVKMKLYNTRTRILEDLVPLKKGQVGIYSCGPTVYGNQHIGHMYAYVQWDVLIRFLRFLGLKVNWVMNITDVGHLTGDNLGDADTGEDKMEKGARKEGLSVWEVADKFLNQFLESIDLLGITRPDVLCRATEHIPEQIELIKRIEANGFTYKTKTGLVFDTSRFPGYADFARLDLKKQQAGKRVKIDPEKRQPWDFLLWVTNQPDHIMKWESPWGTGFPGWHIECTAMSVKYLGQQFDIHTGGQEHIAIHHTNEVAQGFGAYGAQTAQVWLHNSWLTLEGTKISKSLGNVILVSDLKKKGYDPLSLRYLILTSHYRQGLNFTWPGLDGAAKALKELKSIVANLRQTSKQRSTLSESKLVKVRDYSQRFEVALSRDLGAPQALAVVWELAKSNLPSLDKLELLLDFDQVLGLGLAQTEKIKIPVPVARLALERATLRNQKKWAEADKLRAQIEKLGFLVEDQGKEYQIKKK